MNTLYIYHHLGLGDHIICNGLVRYYADRYDIVYLFVKPRNLNNVKYLYRDNDKIKFIPLDDPDVNFFMKFNPNNKYLIVGITKEWFYNFDVLKKYETFDKGFYESANVPFEAKWDNFYFERDIEKEKDVFYNILGLKDNEEYVFIHQGSADNKNFLDKYIPQNIKIINPADYLQVGIFDFLYTIEHAKEVHVANSSFMNIIDCIQLNTDRLFLHSYARTDMGDNPNPALKLNWNILY